MNDKLKAALEKLKSAVTEVESCMSMDSGADVEEDEGKDMPKMADVDLESPEKEEEASEPSDEKENKKQMIMAMMKKKGY